MAAVARARQRRAEGSGGGEEDGDGGWSRGPLALQGNAGLGEKLGPGVGVWRMAGM